MLAAGAYAAFASAVLVAISSDIVRRIVSCRLLTSLFWSKSTEALRLGRVMLVREGRGDAMAGVLGCVCVCVC
jgi:hypothetical protein